MPALVAGIHFFSRRKDSVDAPLPLRVLLGRIAATAKSTP
jgi:hypothetical protein